MISDDRFLVPLYSAAEAARHLDVPVSTFSTWAYGYRNRPRGRPPVVGESIVTTVPAERGASIPFIGLAEAYTLAAIRQAGAPLQRIRPVIHLPKYHHADVVVDPDRAFGAPIFAHARRAGRDRIVRLQIWHGHHRADEEYGLPRADLLDVLRVHTEAA